MHIPLLGGVDPAGQGLGWAPPQIKFYHANPPRGATFVWWPPQNSQSKYPFWWGGPCHPGVGVSPPKINFIRQTHPEEQLLFAGPFPILNPSGFFRRGHYRGYPRESIFWVAPWLGAEPGWNEEPTPNFGVMACVGPAAGRRTYIHTHFHLYILDSYSNGNSLVFHRIAKI
jgi:hypothetical protein